MSDGEDEAAGKNRPPIGSRFKPGMSDNPRGRPKGKRAKDPYEAIFGQLVKLRDNGVERWIRADQALLLHLAARSLSVDAATARTMLLAIEGNRPRRAGGKAQRRIVFRVVAETGNLRDAVQELGCARLLDAYRPSARLGLEAWVIAEALARLGDRQLTTSEQRVVVAAARMPHKVRWPTWWSGNGHQDISS